MNSPKDILNQYAIKPRKNLGQSFLVEEEGIRRIAAIANVQKNDIIVEIGAGIGVLTEYLAQNTARIIAIELDEQLVGVLEDRLAKYKNLEIHHGNILKFDFRTISKAENQKIKVIGNIPYNISSPLLFYLLSSRKIIFSCLLMMQKEFVQRIVALPGRKDYGVPSVILQMFADVEKIMDVPAASFYPRPKVDSSLIKISFLDKPKEELLDEEFFVRIVRDSFAYRRKMLINNLKKSKLIEGVPERYLKELLGLLLIDDQRRGETLSIKEFGCLSNILKEIINK